MQKKQAVSGVPEPTGAPAFEGLGLFFDFVQFSATFLGSPDRVEATDDKIKN